MNLIQIFYIIKYISFFISVIFTIIFISKEIQFYFIQTHTDIPKQRILWDIFLTLLIITVWALPYFL